MKRRHGGRAGGKISPNVSGCAGARHGTCCGVLPSGGRVLGARLSEKGVEGFADGRAVRTVPLALPPLAIAVDQHRDRVLVLTRQSPWPSTTADEVAALTAYLTSPAGAYFSGCLFDLRGVAAAEP